MADQQVFFFVAFVKGKNMGKCAYIAEVCFNIQISACKDLLLTLMGHEEAHLSFYKVVRLFYRMGITVSLQFSQ